MTGEKSRTPGHLHVTDDELARRASRAEFATRAFIVSLVVMVVALLVTIVILVGSVRQTQLEGTPTGKKLVASADRILDCTDPKGDPDSCYQRSQRQTAKIVGQIGAGNILAVVCALQVPDGTPIHQALDQVTDCVAKHLARPANRKP